MFEISIDAIIFYIGSFGVRWYHLTEVLTIALFLGFAGYEARQLGIPLKHMYRLLAIAIAAGLILAKITDIIGRPEYYSTQPGKMFSLAGMRVAGIFAGFFLVKLLYCWKFKLSFWRISDAIVPGAALGYAIFRIGCFLNGCCYGLECPVTWLAVTYTGENTIAPPNVPLYPVQLYQVLWGIVTFAVLWVLRRKLQPTGSLYLLFIMFYAAGDFIIRLFREPDAVLIGIQIQQIVNVIMVLVAIPLLFIRRKRWRQNGILKN